MFLFDRRPADAQRRRAVRVAPLLRARVVQCRTQRPGRAPLGGRRGEGGGIRGPGGRGCE